MSALAGGTAASSDGSPTVSVVIPLYNKRDHVMASVTSALAQTRPAHEIIVVDDGSTDGSDALVRAVKGVHCLQQANAGAAAARNLGIRRASGEWIAFLDADDRWANSKLENQLRFLQAYPDTVWCASNYRHTDGSAAGWLAFTDTGTGWTLHEDWFAANAARDRMLTSGVLLRRDVALACGLFDEGIRYGQDSEFWTRIALEHPRYGFCGAPLFDYVDTAGSVSKPGRARFECRLLVCRRQLERSAGPGRASYRRYALRKARELVRSALSHGQPDIARAALDAMGRDAADTTSRALRLLTRLPPSWQGGVATLVRRARAAR